MHFLWLALATTAAAVTRPDGAYAGPRGTSPLAGNAEPIGWWSEPTDVEAVVKTGPGVAKTALQRMNELLRRQLSDADGIKNTRVYSYDTDPPTSMPTPVPSPIPSPLPSPLPTPAPSSENRTCPIGTYAYELALFDYGGDGWGEGKYELYQFIGDQDQLRELVDEGTLTEGSEQIDSFCLENGNYVVVFGGKQPPEAQEQMGIQWLPDDVQKTTDCRGPCEDPAIMIDGLVFDYTLPPTTFTAAPTSISAAADTWHFMSVQVDGIPPELLPDDDITKLIIQSATNDVIYIVSANDQVIKTDVTLVDEARRRLLDEARRRLQQSDAVHQFDLGFNMGTPYDTCAQVGFTNADDCLEGEGFNPPSLKANLDEAIASGEYKTQLLYWAEYYGRPFPNDFTVTPVLEEPPPEWIYAPTPSPTTTASPTITPEPTVSPEPTPIGTDEPTVTPAPTMTPAPSAEPSLATPGPSAGDDSSDAPTMTPAPTTTPAPTITFEPTAIEPTVSDAPTGSMAPTNTPEPSVSPAPTNTPFPHRAPTTAQPAGPPGPPVPQPTPQPTSGKKKKKKSSDAMSTGEIVGLVVGLILACLICLLCGLYFKQRERSNSIRKESWDMSTMFNDEGNLPPEGEEGGDVTAADDVDGMAPAEEPQALQKITQAAEL